MKSATTTRKTAPPPPESKDEFEQIGDFCEKLSRVVSKNLPEAKREACLRAALASAGAISSNEDRANAYAALAAYLPRGLTDAAFEDFRRRFPLPPIGSTALMARWGHYYRPPLKIPATKAKAKGDKYGKTSYNAAMAFLNNYLKSRGVPEPLQPKLAAKLDALVTAEITGREAAPTLSEAELAAFMAHAAANQWNPESKPKVAPSAFIKETFKDWLGHGLTRRPMSGF